MFVLAVDVFGGRGVLGEVIPYFFCVIGRGMLGS